MPYHVTIESLIRSALSVTTSSSLGVCLTCEACDVKLVLKQRDGARSVFIVFRETDERYRVVWPRLNAILEQNRL